jgi:UDP-glucose 4-epimerase
MRGRTCDPRPIVVLGATGFIGSAVAGHLEQSGACVVRCGRDAIIGASDTLFATLAMSREVVWLAGIASPVRAALHPELTAKDVDSLRGILARRFDTWPRPRLTLTSSGGTVYDTECTPPHAESAATRGIGVYGRSRLQLEIELEHVRCEGDCIVRLPNVYGPGQRLGTGQGVIAHWVSAVRNQMPLPLSSSLQTRRDFVFIDDIARAFVALAELASRPNIINIGSGEPSSLADVAGILSSITGSVRFDVDPESLPLGVPPAVWLDVSLAQRIIGWRPQVDLRDGIARTVAVIPEEGC